MIPPARAHSRGARILNASARAQLVYPGPVGKLLARELRAYGELPWLWEADTFMDQVVEDVMSRPVPPPKPRITPK